MAIQSNIPKGRIIPVNSKVVSTTNLKPPQSKLLGSGGGTSENELRKRVFARAQSAWNSDAAQKARAGAGKAASATGKGVAKGWQGTSAGTKKTIAVGAAALGGGYALGKAGAGRAKKAFVGSENRGSGYNTGHGAIDQFYTAPGFWVVFFLGIGMFLFDIGYSFIRSGPMLDRVLIVYLGVGALAAIQMSNMSGGFDRRIAGFCIRKTLISIFVPLIFVAWTSSELLVYFTERYSAGVADVFSMLTSKWFPLLVAFYAGWAHYLLSQASMRSRLWGTFNTLLTLAIIFSIALPLLSSAFSTSTVSDLGLQSDNVQVAGFADMTKEVWGWMVSGVEIFTGNAVNLTTTKIDQVTQPYYTGEVERSQGMPLGVFIRDVQAIKPVFLWTKKENETYSAIDREVLWFGTASARTFADKEFNLSLSCAYTYGKGEEINVTAKPAKVKVQFTGEFTDEFPFECSIDMCDRDAITDPACDADQIDPNVSYALSGQFVTRGIFNFSTWGYSTITFMDRDTMTAFRREGIDAARAIGVEPRIVAKYTPGPITLGMMDKLAQPFGVDVEDIGKPDSEPAFIPSFGITIENAWRGAGKVVKLHEVIFHVPEPFELEREEPCTGINVTPQAATTTTNRDGLEVIRRADGTELLVNDYYTYYVFKDIPVDEKAYFHTIRCPMIVSSSAPANLFITGTDGWRALLGPDLSPRQFTLVAEASYEYELTTRVPARLGVEVLRP